MLTYQPLPKGDRVAIVTNAGGPGVMATDAAVRTGLDIAQFGPDTTAKLKAALPAAANIKNPVDVIGDARSDRYMAAMEAVLGDENVDQMLVILTPQSMTDIEDIAQGVRRVHAHADKPIACSFMGACDVAGGIDMLQADHIPHYILPEWACRAMADVQRVIKWQSKPIEQPELPDADQAAAEEILSDLPAGYLREDQALAVLKAYGFDVPDYQLCRSADEAVVFADSIGYPVVLRIVSPQVVHKYDVKGVALDLEDAGAVRAAHAEMMRAVKDKLPEAQIDGVIIRPMLPQGHEVILGAKRDAVFGPTLMFGLGGLFVEVFKDVTFALAPIGPESAMRMIRSVKAQSLLAGARGTPPADVDAICRSLLRLSRLVTDQPRIVELDINPLLVWPAGQGAAVADIRIRINGKTLPE